MSRKYLRHKKTRHFGEHLTIDGYGGDKKLLNDKKLVLKTLKELPELLDMKALSHPCVLYAKGNDKKDPGGWSGFVIIAESHVSVHTFPLRRFVSIDVYTCKNGLDTKTVGGYFKTAFDLKDLEVNFIRRGTKYPSRNVA